MKIIVHLFALALSHEICLAQSEKVQKTGDSNLVRNIILEQARSLGYLGESINIKTTVKCSLVMKLYIINDGIATLVQSSQPSLEHQEFSYGYISQPYDKDNKYIRFIYSCPDDPMVKEPTNDLSIKEYQHYKFKNIKTNSKNPGWHFGCNLIPPPEMDIEYITRYHGVKSILDIKDYNSITKCAKMIENGYMITATLITKSEQAAPRNR